MFCSPELPVHKYEPLLTGRSYKSTVMLVTKLTASVGHNNQFVKSNSLFDEKERETKITVSVSRYTTTTWMYTIESYPIKGRTAAPTLLHTGP